MAPMAMMAGASKASARVSAAMKLRDEDALLW
jgi:hypothetical protein